MYEKISGGYSRSTGKNVADREAQAELTFEIASKDSSDISGLYQKIAWSLSSKAASSEKSGHPLRQPVRLQSSGSLFALRGRSITYIKGIVVREVPFELSIDDAQTLESHQDSGDIEFKNILRNQSKITVKASNFSNGNHPVADLTLTFIIGEYNTGDAAPHPVLLCNGKVHMRYDGNVTIPAPVPGSPDIISHESTIISTTEHVFDRIILLTSQVDLPKDQSSAYSQNSKKIDPINYAVESKKNFPQLLIKILTVSLLVAIIVQPIRWSGDGVYESFVLSLSTGTYLWVSSLIYYLLQIIRILLILSILVIFMATPMRYDFLQDIPVYFCVYFRSFFLLREWDGGRLSFFVHGWNAWGFCGAVKQGAIFNHNG